ncbi:MAG: BatD family protein [candidate division KSB1 bacterium]|nr:BatD family protein [candidate division KSB1 bacterium]
MRRVATAAVWTIGFLVGFQSEPAGALSEADTLALRLAPAPEIALHASLDRTQVPLNRTVTLSVELRWDGEPYRYEVADVGTPVVRNLEVLGSGSSNRVEAGSGGQSVVVQTHRFVLKPKELGMAYVEPMSVLYTDTRTGVSQRLRTQRLQLEVTDPVPEGRGGRHWFVYLTAGVGLAAAGGIYYFRRTHGGLPQPELPPPPSWEEQLLAELREAVGARTLASQVRDSYAGISKIARRYLVTRYGLSGLELTTSELLRELRQKTADERLIAQAEELLRRCDQVRFGGETGDFSEVSRLAGMVEWWLTRPQP